jgi:hypothetical protein
MKYKWNAKEIVNGWNGKPIRIPVQEDPNDEKSPIKIMDATIRDVMLILANNASFKTLEDSREGRRMVEALEESRKTDSVEIDQGTHNWLKKQGEAIIPQVFRVSGEIIDNIIREGYRRTTEPKKVE